MKIGIVFLAFTLLLGSGLAFSEPCERVHRLFVIERNKNGNRIQYDVCVNANSDLVGLDPVKAYWVLESGEKEKLNFIETRYAYGILSQERLGRNRFAISLVALKGREIIIEKIEDRFRAVLPIRGTQSFLDKVYVDADEKWTGLPKVQYVDLFGWTALTYTPVEERITVK